MKRAIFMILLVNFCIPIFAQPKSFNEFKAYMQTNILSIDPIEGLLVTKKNAGAGKYVDTQYFIFKKDGLFKTYIVSGSEVFEANYSFKKAMQTNNYIGVEYLRDEQLPTKIDEFGRLQISSKYGTEIWTKEFPSIDDYQDAQKKIQQEEAAKNKLRGCSGFVISTDGYILTNYSVIENKNKIFVKGINGDFSKIYDAKLIVSDKSNDLAIIKIEGLVLKMPPFTLNNELIDVGNEVFSLGFNDLTSSEIKLNNSIISSKVGLDNDISSYAISSVLTPNNVGSPLFDKQGSLIGIINLKNLGIQNSSFATKTNYISNLISLLPLKIKFQVNNILASKSLSEKVKILKDYICIIEAN